MGVPFVDSRGGSRRYMVPFFVLSQGDGQFCEVYCRGCRRSHVAVMGVLLRQFPAFGSRYCFCLHGTVGLCGLLSRGETPVLDIVGSVPYCGDIDTYFPGCTACGSLLFRGTEVFQ